jgi:Tol biopolymer transport system component
VTSDDGHNLTGGTIYYSDVLLTERTPLTDGSGPISQMPTIGPDGQSVAFEAGGNIYTGELR